MPAKLSRNPFDLTSPCPCWLARHHSFHGDASGTVLGSMCRIVEKRIWVSHLYRIRFDKQVETGAPRLYTSVSVSRERSGRSDRAHPPHPVLSFSARAEGDGQVRCVRDLRHARQHHLTPQHPGPLADQVRDSWVSSSFCSFWSRRSALRPSGSALRHSRSALRHSCVSSFSDVACFGAFVV